MEATYSLSNEDRISELPEPLIHQILSALDIESAVQTSVLSTRWRHIWPSIWLFLPTLNINSNIFFRENCRYMVSFLGFLNMFLEGSSCDLQRLYINLSDAPQKEISIINQLNRWILCALRRDVQELYVHINFRVRFELLPCVFNSESLTKLELAIVVSTEKWRIYLPNSMDLPRLKYLKLSHISINYVNIINRLISSCPMLESLIITDSDIATDEFKNINIDSVKLKHFELSDCRYIYCSCYVEAKCVRLYAPNLVSFVCKDRKSQIYSLENLSSLVYANRIADVLKGLHNVKQLTLSLSLLEVFSGFPNLLESNCPQLTNLRCLKLDIRLSKCCLRATTYLLKICPNIQSLLLRISDQTNSEKIATDWRVTSSFLCHLHQLKVIKVRGLKGYPNELKILEILLNNAVVLEQLFLFSIDVFASDKVKKMIKKILRKLPRASTSI